jgi:hypothetical protein
VTGTASHALFAGAVQAVHVWPKSLSKERHFDLSVDSASRLFLASNSSVVTGTAHFAHPAGALQSALDWSKSFSKDMHFTLELDSVSRLYLASHCRERGG